LRKLSTGLCTDSVYKSCGFFRQCVRRFRMDPASGGARRSNCRPCLVTNHLFDQHKLMCDCYRRFLYGAYRHSSVFCPHPLEIGHRLA
jgi:hypothetical protein